MASMKKPGFIVETKPILERKRRKSDLVVMWQSFWDVTMFIALEMWATLLGIWEMTKKFVCTDEHWEIRTWLEKYLTRVPDDFSESWRDGILLCKLLNKLQPGCYPDAEKLDINFGLSNLFRAFHILEARFDIIPKVTVEEVVTCAVGSDSKLLKLLLQLRQKTDDVEYDMKIPAEPSETNEHKSKISDSKNCVAKGTGLMVGFVGRPASFVVFHSSVTDLNLVVEIKGPSNSMCSGRITNRSPKKKKTVKSWKPCSPYNFVRSSSNGEDDNFPIINNKKTMTNNEKYHIPLDYEIHMNQINFTYVPVIKGSHRITILSHGQSVSDSPYLVMVEPVVTTHRNNSIKHIKSALKHSDNHPHHEEQRKKSTVRFQESSESKESLGKIIKRKVLRYVVKIDKKDVVVETDSIDNLATSLLKMDYELQKRPLNRRNSWGFVGDAERKVSVIRQFCVDLDELEKQSAKMQRSNSFTLSSKSKKPVRKSSSYECEDIVQQTKLETVTEGTVSNFQSSSSVLDEDEVFAYLNIDFDSGSQTKAEDTGKELINANTNSVKSFEYEPMKEPLLEKEMLREVSQSLKTSRIQMLADSERIETQNPTDFDDIPADRLTSASDSSSRFDLQEICKESVSSACKTGVDSVSLENCDKEKITVTKSENCQVTFQREELSDCHLMNRRFGIVESNSQEFEIFENTDDVFIGELPFTKTDKRTLSTQRYHTNVDILSIDSEVQLNKDQNSNCIHNKQTPLNNFLENNNMVEIEQISKSTESFKNKSSKGINNDTVLDCFVKNEHEKCYQHISENTTYSKVKNKKLHTNIKTRMKKGVLKYQYLRSKIPSQYASSFERKRSNSSKGLKYLNEQKPQCTLQHVKSVEPSPLSCRELKKFGKSPATSEPTNFSSKHEEVRKKLEDHFMRNLNNSNKYEIKEDNFKHSTYLNTKKEFQHSSYLPHPCFKAKQTQKESEKKLNHMSTNVRREYQTLPSSLQNNFSSPNFSEDTNLNKTHYLPQEASLSGVLKINRNRSVYSCVSTNCENSNDITQLNPAPMVTGQFNFKHFNPPLRSDRESPVRKQIKHWENSVASGGDKPMPKHAHKLHVLPDLVNIKAKLRFWEHANNHFLKEDLKDMDESKNLKGIRKVEKKTNDAAESTLGENLKGNLETENHFSNDECKEKNLHSTEAHSLEKNIGGKLLFNTDPSKTRKRSFSDPCVLEPSEKKTNGDIQQLEYGNDIINTASSKDEMSSSYDGNFIELSADDEDSSGELFCSTEDEYIDDEISENISTYWGDLSIMKGLNFSDISDYKEFFDLMTSDGFSNQTQSFQLCAAQCKFFGIAAYFGHVAVKNRFWVLTKGAGRGNLSVSVQGFGQHNVAFVGVQYTQKDIYEVTYQIFIPGLYLISVRWMDAPIAGSPFLCKVTF